MARPKKDNADYFSHDKNMRNDPKIKALRRKFKDGYSVWNMMLEALTEANFFTIELTPLELELLSGDFDVETEHLVNIIDYCVVIGLLIKEENTIYSSGLKKRLQPVIDNRNAVKQRFLDKKLKDTTVSEAETTQSKVKYSKVKESIKVVEEDTEAETLNFEKKIEQEVFINEEEYSAAVDCLKSSSMFTVLQKQQQLNSAELLKHFEFFYETKFALNELGKTKHEVLKNFLFWLPGHITRTRKTQSNGSSNFNQRGSATTTTSSDEKRASRKAVIDGLRSLL